MKPIEIRAHILLAGKNMKQFAEMIGTTRQTIHAVVNGRTVSKKYRLAIAAFIKKPVTDIWPEKTKNPAPAVNNDEKRVETVGT